MSGKWRRYEALLPLRFNDGREVPGDWLAEAVIEIVDHFGSASYETQKVEGHVTFHTAMSTAFPQPAPGTAPSPGPMKLADDRLRKVLGLSRMSFHDVNHPIAITDLPLEAEMPTAGAHDVVVDNFSFAPAMASVPVGTVITWTNRDDVPHTIVSTEQKFKSPVLDTDGQFAHRFDAPGTYKYFCSIHPKMTGQVVVG